MTDLKELLIARLKRYDSTLNLTEDSALMATVINPVASVFGDGPLSEDTKSFLVNKIEEAFPDIHATPGDALYDILVSGSSLFFDAYSKELSRIENAQSINNIDTLSEADVDDLAANWLVSRNSGALSSCRVRILFSAPTSIRLDANILFYTADGLIFRTDGTYVISAGAMAENQLSEDEYFLDISVLAESSGAKYNIGVGGIIGVTGIPEAYSVTNTTPGIGGRDRESNESMMLSRLPQAVSERSLVTPRGIRARLLSAFPELLRISVIGFGDPEMVRDLAKSGGDGPLVVSGFAFIHVPSMKAVLCHAAKTALINEGDVVKLTIPPIAVDLIGAELSASLIIESIDLLGASLSIIPRTFTTVCTLSGDLPSLEGEWAAGYMSVHKSDLLIVNGESLDTKEHLGGNTDVYIHPVDDLSASSQIKVSPSKVVFSGTGVGSTLGSNKIILNLSPTHTQSEFSVGRIIKIQGLDSLYTIMLASFEPTRAILYIDSVVDSSLSIDTGVRWYLYSDLSVNISRTYEDILPLPNGYLTCSGLLGDSSVEVNSDISIQSIGLDLNQNAYLLIVHLDGLQFTASIIGIGESSIQISSPLRTTVHNASCEIKLSKGSVALPLAHVQSVAIDSAQIPYGKSYGGRVLNLGGARERQSGLVGVVAPKFDKMLSKLAVPSLSSLDMDSDSYLASMSADYAVEVGHLLPFSYGIASPKEGAGIIRYKHRRSGVEAYGEVVLPLDLFLPGNYNVFIAQGNLLYEEVISYLEGGAYKFTSNMEPPVIGNKGDTLTISKGPNSGEYIIDEVYQIELRLDSIYTEADIETYQGARDDLQGISGDPNYLVREVQRAETIRLSVVKVASPFNVSSMSMYEDEFTLNTPPDEISPSDTVIDLKDLLSMLMDPSRLINTGSPTSPLSDAAASRLGINVVADLSDLATATSSLALESYSVGTPAKGTMRIYYEGGTRVGLPLPAPPVIMHSQVNMHLFNLSSGESTEKVLAPSYFIASYNDLSLCVPTSSSSSSLVYGGEDIEVDSPLTWRRDLDTSRVSADAPEGFYIPSNILLNGRSPNILSQDEERIGLDLIEIPSDYSEPVTELTLNQREELRLHKEAVFPDYDVYIDSPVQVHFSILPSTTPLSFGADGIPESDSASYTVVRKGILYVEPRTIYEGYVPSWWLGGGDAVTIVNSLTLSRDSATPLVYIRLNDIASLEDFIYLYSSAPDGVDAIAAKNIYGRTLLEELNITLEIDPRAVVVIHSEGGAIDALPSKVTDYVNAPTRLSVKAPVSINASEPPSGMLVGETVIGSNVISLVNPYASSIDFGLNSTHIGAFLYIDSGPDSGGYTIIDIDAGLGLVYLDRSLTSSTSVISAKGIIAINTSDDFKTLYMGNGDVTQRINDGDFIPRSETSSPSYALGSPVLGSSTRMIVPTDAGKYLSLYSLVRRPDSSVYPEGTQLTPVRRHLGAYKIETVTSHTAVDEHTGDTLQVSSSIRVETAIDLSDIGDQLREYEEVFFVLTEDPVPPQEEGDLKSIVPIHIYETEATAYRIIGYQPDVASDSARQIAVSTQGYDVPSSSESLSPFESYSPQLDGVVSVNISMDRRNPYAIVRTDLVSFEASGVELGLSYVDVPIQSMGHREAYNEVDTEIFDTSNELIDGYILSNNDQDDAFSSEEDVQIQLLPRTKVGHQGVSDQIYRISTLQEVSIEYVHSPTVNSVHSLVNVGDERVVCSDIRVKRMLPAYIGAEVHYTGDPSIYDLADSIQIQLRNNILGGVGISPTTLVSSAYSKGATNVTTALLYYCVIDRNRDRKLEIVSSELSQSSLVAYDGTVRITGLMPSTSSAYTLNAGVRVFKSPQSTRIGRGI